MKVFAIKHRTTGEFLPAGFKGASWWDGTAPGHKGPPRLFASKKAALSFVYQWERGRMTERRRPGSMFEEAESVLIIEDVGRERDDLIVCAMHLELWNRNHDVTS